MESYNFSQITFQILRKITNIELGEEENKFDEWFGYNYKLNNEEENFLQNIIKKEKIYLHLYNEELLKARFLHPLLNMVDFRTKNFRDWYAYPISAVVNGYKLSGLPDFMVATGLEFPEKPYFFIQEFKKQLTNSDPLRQLLSEMAVAISYNKVKETQGAYNIGQFWKFVILTKLDESKYQYYESQSLDCLKINDLKQIYQNLQAVKHKYCK